MYMKKKVYRGTHLEMQYGSSSKGIWEMLDSVFNLLWPQASLTTQKTRLHSKDKGHAPGRRLIHVYSVDNCLMLPVNSEMSSFWRSKLLPTICFYY